MKSKKLPSIRQFGQLPLPSSFIIKPSNNNSNSESEQQNPQSTKKSPISLSDFLKRKLDKDATPKTPPPPRTTQEQGGSSSVNECIGMKRRPETEPPLDEKLFQLFKHPREGQHVSGHGLTSDCNLEGSAATKEQNPRPQNPFRVSSSAGKKRSSTAAGLVVLGDDPKPKLKRRNSGFIQNKRPKPLYNHYASGSGWWDCNMEGIDHEEVGCTDVWEGMGATANLGGLEWH